MLTHFASLESELTYCKPMLKQQVDRIKLTPNAKGFFSKCFMDKILQQIKIKALQVKSSKKIYLN